MSDRPAGPTAPGPTAPGPTTLPEVEEIAGSPWPALWALVVGFFMILVDTTIVQVATPAIMSDLDASVNAVIWATSAYLLAYAVPLLITGRLGDRIGPRTVYLAGLALFTAASLWCGLTGSIEGLIVARVFQGFGAAMMTPQTMAVITRIFPAARRGRAMALWGAVAGIALLAGPLLGGLLVGTLGWEWIFFVNVPVGLIGFVLAWRLVPRLPTRTHSFDLVGVALSAVGLFLLVFGLQEAETYAWGTIAGPVTVWRLIIAGLLVLAAFVWWQSRVRVEPLVPLRLFRDRNFSLSALAIAAVGFSLTSMGFPYMLYAQEIRGMSPTAAALVLVPMAVLSGVLAPLVGRLVDRVHPRVITGFGVGTGALALTVIGLAMARHGSLAPIVAGFVLLGLANAFIWAPLAATATRNLPMASAGAGAGVYNTTRQLGAVLGSAAIAATMASRLAVEVPDLMATDDGAVPARFHDGYAAAMGQAMLVPAGVLVVGLIAVLFFTRIAAPPTPPRVAHPDDATAHSTL